MSPLFYFESASFLRLSGQILRMRFANDASRYWRRASDNLSHGLLSTAYVVLRGQQADL
jgi:hypothetical protein